MPYRMARRYGRRLTPRYGIEEDCFVLGVERSRFIVVYINISTANTSYFINL